MLVTIRVSLCGTSVGVDGTGVGVGGTGVGVGGARVSVGGTGVAVAGAGVGVGATGVAGGDGLGPQALTVKARKVIERNSEVTLFISSSPGSAGWTSIRTLLELFGLS